MKRLKYLIIFAIILLIPNTAKADECPVANISRLKKISSNITSKYDYVEYIPQVGYGNVLFTVTINNVVPEIYVKLMDDYYSQDGNVYFGNIDNQIIISNLQSGRAYRFIAYSNTNDICRNINIYEFYVRIPSYNKFYLDPLCNRAPNYDYCQKWTEVKLTDQEFNESINRYITSIGDGKNNEEVPKPNDKYKLFLAILEFLNKYNIPIFGGIVILSAIGIYVYNKKNSFDLDVK